MTDTPSDLVKNIIQAQIIAALNTVPDAIEKLVQAALSRPVNPQNGRDDGYSINRVPYLDYIVGDEIRQASIAAVRKVVQESSPRIEAEIRKGLSSDTVVAALVNAFVGASQEQWRIDVKFAPEDKL